MPLDVVNHAPKRIEPFNENAPGVFPFERLPFVAGTGAARRENLFRDLDEVRTERAVAAEERIEREELDRTGRQRWAVTPCTPVIGDLLDSIRECLRDEGSDYLRHFRAARHGLLSTALS